jgi:hypothetical protein
MSVGTREDAVPSRRRIVTPASRTKPRAYLRIPATLRGFMPSRRELEFTFLAVRRGLRRDVELLRRRAVDVPRYELVVSVLCVSVAIAAGILIATI